MRITLFIIYNLFLYPSFLLIALFLSIFNSKIRRGIKGRFQTKNILIKYFNQKLSNKVIYWFHASSYGEYLQIEPVINILKEKKVNSVVLLSFFSPSGYDNVNNKNVDCKVYMPFDFYWTMQNTLKLVKPNKIVFSTTDLWYNFIWSSINRNIDTILIGAKSKSYFNKNFSILNYVYKPIYKSITKIITINDNDRQEIEKFLGKNKIKRIFTLGNPRFDQVIEASNKLNNDKKKPIQDREDIIMFASMHSEDRNIVLSKIIKYMGSHKKIQIIWVSHEPKNQENKYIESMFNRNDISARVINSIQSFDNDDSKVKIINLVGVLSKLYWKVKLAYIGGGFSTGVHNLMEPSVAGVPTVFGPNYHDFGEAIDIINNKAGFCVGNSSELIKIIDKYLNDDQGLDLASNAAIQLVKNNAGSSNNIVDEIISD